MKIDFMVPFRRTPTAPIFAVELFREPQGRAPLRVQERDHPGSRIGAEVDAMFCPSYFPRPNQPLVIGKERTFARLSPFEDLQRYPY